MQTEYSVLGYIVDLYFHDYKLSKEVDEFGYSDRNIDYEIKDKKQYKKNLVLNLLEIILMKRLIFSHS